MWMMDYGCDVESDGDDGNDTRYVGGCATLWKMRPMLVRCDASMRDNAHDLKDDVVNLRCLTSSVRISTHLSKMALFKYLYLNLRRSAA